MNDKEKTNQGEGGPSCFQLSNGRLMAGVTRGETSLKKGDNVGWVKKGRCRIWVEEEYCSIYRFGKKRRKSANYIILREERNAQSWASGERRTAVKRRGESKSRKKKVWIKSKLSLNVSRCYGGKVRIQKKENKCLLVCLKEMLVGGNGEGRGFLDRLTSF